MTEHSDRLEILVRDEGVGFDPLKAGGKHFGLTGIRQRAKILGGTVHIDSEPGRGTTVCIVLPRRAG